MQPQKSKKADNTFSLILERAVKWFDSLEKIPGIVALYDDRTYQPKIRQNLQRNHRPDLIAKLFGRK